MTVYEMPDGSLVVFAPWTGVIPVWMRGRVVRWLDPDDVYSS